MPENEVEVGQETAEKTTKTKKQPASAKAKEEKKTATDEIMSAIKNMTVLELAELVKALEAEFGVSAAAPVVATAAATAAPTTAAAPAAEEEQTEFTAILKDVGAKVIDTDARNVNVADFTENRLVTRALLEDDEGVRWLVGTDGSTSRVYHMRVPSECQTCKEAHEALCGFDESTIVSQS